MSSFALFGRLKAHTWTVPRRMAAQPHATLAVSSKSQTDHYRPARCRTAYLVIQIPQVPMDYVRRSLHRGLNGSLAAEECTAAIHEATRLASALPK